ncbi:MAG: phosphoribosylamine--glycine ligase [Candidatus Kryptoniota bacterium]
MKVLVIGGGGREHAIVDAIIHSDPGASVYCVPGNAGIAGQAKCPPINPDNFSDLVSFCNEEGIELTVVGPEQYLSNGIVDFFIERGLRIFGPTRAAARLETSKVFAKHFMKRWNIPTAEFRIFNKNQRAELKDYLRRSKYPVVLKADGLAAGKGVIIVNDYRQGELELSNFFDRKVFGSAGETIVVEEFLDGVEASLFAVTDGRNYVLLPAAQDYKRIGENDTGLNTGGMGSYAPTPFLDKKNLDIVKSEVIERVIEGTNAESFPFRGCLYCGLMITDDGPKVVEFNSRFGDPETQSVLPLIEPRFLDLVSSCVDGELSGFRINIGEAVSVCVVAASRGYPGKYESGKEIKNLNTALNDVRIYHSGTKFQDGRLVTSGGRVLSTVGIDRKGSYTVAAERAYKALDLISFEGMYFRRDIGNKVIKQEK